MKEPKDKRTLEYKEWKKNFDNDNSIGAGDIVEKITKATGIKKIVEAFTPEGKDCGCDERKKKLNKTRIKTTALRCLTEQQYNTWKSFLKRERRSEVTNEQQVNIIIPIYAHIFALQHKVSSCGSCVKKLIDEINVVFDTYETK